MRMTIRPLAPLAALFAIGCAFAQQEAPSAPPATKPLRVHVIGASVSGGFRDGPAFRATEQGDTVPLHVVLKAWCGEHARATTHSTTQMTGMFTDPLAIGEAQVAAAVKAKPDAVVAIDFPFWFAYGGAGVDELATRKAKFEQGLARMARLEMPVLFGDLPNMKGAAARMLAPSWVPSEPVLRALNERLAAWIAEKPNRRLVSLTDVVARMRSDGVDLPLAGGALRVGPRAVLQQDMLHANRLGMAFLGLSLQPALQALFPDGHALRTQAWTFEQFVAACGAEADLEAARAAAKDAAKEPAKAGAK
jgi:hypothetical protein